MISSYILLALASITHRKLRSWLTLIGILIGIMAVVALISLSQGMENAIEEEFKSIGANRVIVAPGGSFMGPGSTGLTTAKFYETDLKAVKSIEGIQITVPVLVRTAKIEFEGKTIIDRVMGTPTEEEILKVTKKMDVYKVEEGRKFNPGERYSIILTHRLANDAFDKKIEVGKKVKVNGVEFEVVGIKPEGGHNAISGNWIPLPIARDLFNEPNEISSIFVLTKDDYNPSIVAEEIKRKLRKERNVKEGFEDFYVQTAEQIINTFLQIIAVVKAVLIGIAAISLAVGGVGIMNTMYTSVVERTKEIGIMKSIGATNEAIAALFMIESGMLGMIGGIFGVIGGVGIGLMARFLADKIGGIALQPEITFILIIGAIAFSFVIGVIAGVLPAMKAARLQPTEALQR